LYIVYYIKYVSSSVLCMCGDVTVNSLWVSYLLDHSMSVSGKMSPFAVLSLQQDAAPGTVRIVLLYQTSCVCNKTAYNSSLRKLFVYFLPDHGRIINDSSAALWTFYRIRQSAVRHHSAMSQAEASTVWKSRPVRAKGTACGKSEEWKRFSFIFKRDFLFIIDGPWVGSCPIILTRVQLRYKLYRESSATLRKASYRLWEIYVQ